MLQRLYRTLLVIGFSIRPASPGKSKYILKTTPESSHSLSIHVVASNEAIRYYLSDMCKWIDRQGELRLLFPGCHVLAAPFLLYRLKRSGFSDCRALMTGEGLLITAVR